MGSWHQNSNNQNNYSTEKEEGDKNDDGGVSGAAVGFTAVAGAAALAVWGLSKLFGSSKPEENNMLMGSTATGSVKHQGIDNYNMLMGSTSSVKHQGMDNILIGSTATGSFIYDDDKWTKPEYGWFKLNTDASAFPHSIRKAAAGGLIRDHRGEWIIGFTANLETSDILLAELHAVREGMKLALKEGLKKVIIETDSEQAVDLIKNPNIKVNPKNHSLRYIIDECRNLMMKRGYSNIIELNHICREKNRCADAMARLAKNHTEELIIWEEPPRNVHIQNLLSADMDD